MFASRRSIVPLSIELIMLGCACSASAQNYPTRAIRLVVPFSAGSTSDTIGRVVARGLSQSFNQQVYVDNRSGAYGGIGAEIAAKAAPDGYTMLLVNIVHAANATLSRIPACDLRRDLAPVTQIASSPSVVVVHPLVPAKSIAALVKLAKNKPGDMNYSSSGVGTPTFVAGELFKKHAGIDLVHVPYRSRGDAITAVLAGEVSVYFAPFATALGHIRSLRLQPLGVTSAQRVPLLPAVPTVAESGYPGYQAGNWYGLAVPLKTADETIAAIRGAMLNALKSPDTNRNLVDLGYILIGDDPDEFAAHIGAEIEKLAKILPQVKS